MSEQMVMVLSVRCPECGTRVALNPERNRAALEPYLGDIGALPATLPGWLPLRFVHWDWCCPTCCDKPSDWDICEDHRMLFELAPALEEQP